MARLIFKRKQIITAQCKQDNEYQREAFNITNTSEDEEYKDRSIFEFQFKYFKENVRFRIGNRGHYVLLHVAKAFVCDRVFMNFQLKLKCLIVIDRCVCFLIIFIF